MRQRKQRRSFPAAMMLLVLLIAAAFALVVVLYNHSDRYSHNKGEYYAGPVTDQAVLLISSDVDQPSRRYFALRTAFAEAGISSLYLQVSADHSLSVIEQIESAMERLGRLSGLPPENQWLLAEGREAANLAENAGKTPAAGFVYLCPTELDRISAAVWSVYPVDRPTIVLTGQEGFEADQAISLFEQQTGEDARLFSGASASGWFSAEQYRSVDGRFVLKRYPLLRSQLSTHDLRIISDLSAELAAYHAATANNINSIAAKAALSQLNFLRSYLLVGLLILSLPVMLSITLRKKTTAFRRSVRLDCFTLRSPLIYGLMWLPAIGLCIGLVSLISQWNYPMQSPWAGLLFFLPGSYGLVNWIASLITRQQRPTERINLPDQPDSTTVAGGRLIIFLISIYTLIIAVFLIWRWLMFGWTSSLQLSPMIMVIFFVWNFPGSWPDQHNSSDLIIDQRSLFLPAWHLISRSWPYLTLMVLVPFLVDGTALMIFVILMAFLYWSDLAGREVTILTGRCWVGRLARSLLLTLSWFHPALLPSVFY